MDAFKLSLEEAGIEPTKENIDSPANLLKKTLDTESEVVLLVDEYDAPLTAVLNDSNELVLPQIC